MFSSSSSWSLLANADTVCQPALSLLCTTLYLLSFMREERIERTPP